eukprot:3890898-Prorocentrum_lima.AAC.1
MSGARPVVDLFDQHGSKCSLSDQAMQANLWWSEANRSAGFLDFVEREIKWRSRQSAGILLVEWN